LPHLLLRLQSTGTDSINHCHLPQRNAHEKKHFWFILLLATSTGAVAQGYFEPIPYYNNNPFPFCQYGVIQDCWCPINPATGTFGITYYCFNEYSATMYARVCPQAFPAGMGTSLPPAPPRD